MRPFIPLLFATCLLAACGGGSDPVDNDADGAGLPQPVGDSTPDAAGAPPNGQIAPDPATPASSGVIPAPLQGRWGLNPADCTSTRGDAKGLLIITADQLRFYESRAVPGADVEFDDNSVNGHFNFTGEGQTWSKFQSLKAQGNRLVRTETQPAASFTYAKC